MNAAPVAPSRSAAWRIGDADRQAAADSLAAHWAAGRLDAEEFDERLACIVTARTQAELDVQFADLPPLAPGTAPVPRRVPGHVALWVALLLLFLVVGAIALNAGVAHAC